MRIKKKVKRKETVVGLVSLPMDADIVFDMIDNFDKYSVVFPSNYGGTRKLTIDCDNGFT